MSEVRDVVILLPGITGSALARNGKEVWGTSGGALWRAVRSLGGSIEDLELASDGGPGNVTAVRLIPDVTIVPGLVKIDGYSAIERYLIDKLELTPGKNYFPFPYDWRLDNRASARKLESFAMDKLNKWKAMPGNDKARLVLIGHSMGGLISRYFLECLGGWTSTRMLITLGTPHRGSLNAVDFLEHGLKKGVGPLGVDLTPLLRSLPSVYQLLPNYACIDTGEPKLTGVVEAAKSRHLPNIDEKRARDARNFHNEIFDAQAANSKDARYQEQGYVLRPLVGVEQPTSQSARCRNSKVELLRSLDGTDDAGDGTVPQISAVPMELDGRNVELYAAEKHGSLQNLEAALTNIRGFLMRPDIKPPRLLHGGLGTDIALDVDDVALPGEPLVVRVRAVSDGPQVQIVLTNTQTNKSVGDTLRATADWQELAYELEPGTWRISVSGNNVNPVNDLALVAAS